MSYSLISSQLFRKNQGHCGRCGMQYQVMPACAHTQARPDTNSPAERLRQHAPGDIYVND
jgi:hypothetical protein